MYFSQFRAWKSDIKGTAWLVSSENSLSEWIAIFLLYPAMVEEGERALWGPFYSGMNPI